MTVRKFLFLLAGTAVLCIPAVSIAATTPSSANMAVKMCRSLRAQEGKHTFRLAYHSFAGCLRQTRPEAKQAIKDAVSTCRAQRTDPNFAATHDGKSFNQFYGTNAAKGQGADKNAFGKCVSSLAKQTAKSDVTAAIAAAKTCKAMKQGDLATFQTNYGTNRNAFGKCVAAQTPQS